MTDAEKAQFLMDLLTKAGKVSIVKNALAWLSGKKTYIVAALTIAFGILEATGHPIPAWVYAVLAGAGFTVMRLGVAKSQAATTAVLDVVNVIKDQTPVDGKSEVAALIQEAAAQFKDAGGEMPGKAN